MSGTVICSNKGKGPGSGKLSIGGKEVQISLGPGETKKVSYSFTMPASAYDISATLTLDGRTVSAITIISPESSVPVISLSAPSSQCVGSKTKAVATCKNTGKCHGSGKLSIDGSETDIDLGPGETKNVEYSFTMPSSSKTVNAELTLDGKTDSAKVVISPLFAIPHVTLTAPSSQCAGSEGKAEITTTNIGKCNGVGKLVINKGKPDEAMSELSLAPGESRTFTFSYRTAGAPYQITADMTLGEKTVRTTHTVNPIFPLLNVTLDYPDRVSPGDEFNILANVKSDRCASDVIVQTFEGETLVASAEEVHINAGETKRFSIPVKMPVKLNGAKFTVKVSPKYGSEAVAVAEVLPVNCVIFDSNIQKFQVWAPATKMVDFAGIMLSTDVIPSKNLEVASLGNAHLLKARILGSGYIEADFEGFEFLGLTVSEALKICVDREMRGKDRSAVIYSEVPSLVKAPLRFVGISPSVKTIVGTDVPVDMFWSMCHDMPALRRAIAEYYGIVFPPL